MDNVVVVLLGLLLLGGLAWSIGVAVDRTARQLDWREIADERRQRADEVRRLREERWRLHRERRLLQDYLTGVPERLRDVCADCPLRRLPRRGDGDQPR